MLTSCSFPLWGKVGMGAVVSATFFATDTPTPTLPQGGRERAALRVDF